MKVEIWDSDPTCGCCGGPMMMSQKAMRKIMESLKEKNRTLQRLREEFKDIDLEIDTVSPQRPMSSYPEHVTKLLQNGAKAPMVLIEGEVVVESRFPSYDEIKQAMDERIGSHSGQTKPNF